MSEQEQPSASEVELDVNTPEDAYRCFMRTEMDYLVMENILIDKTKQPEWQEEGDWRNEFALD